MASRIANSLERLNLSEREARAVCDFCAWLQAVMPDQVERLILFGSKARGDTHDGSDVDILLALRHPTREQRDAIALKIGDLLEETHVDLAVVTYPHDELEHWLALGTPFICNVASEGIALIGDNIMIEKTQPETVARGFIQSAHRRLHAAAVLVEAGESRASISPSFYAFLDAADAALVARGIRTKSHAGTLDLFNLHFVKTGLVETHYGAWFRKIRKDRLEADYERLREFTETEGRLALERATQFVSAIEALLPALSVDATHSHET